MDKFPILALPAVPLRQVLGGLCPIDLFELLQCSSRTKEILKSFEKANKTFKVGVDFQRNWVEIKGVCKFYVKEEDNNMKMDKENKKRTFCDREVPISTDEAKATNTYWPAGEKLEGTMNVGQNFVKTLGVGQLDQILISAENPAAECLSWLENCNVRLENFNLVGAEPSHADKLATTIFSDDFLSKVSVNFTSLLEPSEGWRPINFSGDMPVNMFKIHLHHSQWFTGKQLMAMNCSSIILHHSALKNEDIKKYLEAWKSGAYPKFMYLSVHVNEANKLNFNSIVNGLTNNQPTVADNTTSVEFQREDGDSIEICLGNGGKHFTAFIN
ncbi:hypothetical protein GCK72_022798 [Caenorhabditis remanei]|uniref:F-box domain-containing protein n=1 Tax=Caenorhabditis remanei TaxID=31234 RepID=A0A6A5FV16_CAERE|nr:hypothetical protein GCK72_022798 [Caenorhabditis remanei]KAF1746345.1 hypothetical protein GCK72_022798 [Caenorhabditis remanei]